MSPPPGSQPGAPRRQAQRDLRGSHGPDLEPGARGAYHVELGGLRVHHLFGVHDPARAGLQRRVRRHPARHRINHRRVLHRRCPPELPDGILRGSGGQHGEAHRDEAGHDSLPLLHLLAGVRPPGVDPLGLDRDGPEAADPPPAHEGAAPPQDHARHTPLPLHAEVEDHGGDRHRPGRAPGPHILHGDPAPPLLHLQHHALGGVPLVRHRHPQQGQLVGGQPPQGHPGLETPLRLLRLLHAHHHDHGRLRRHRRAELRGGLLRAAAPPHRIHRVRRPDGRADRPHQEHEHRVECPRREEEDPEPVHALARPPPRPLPRGPAAPPLHVGVGRLHRVRAGHQGPPDTNPQERALLSHLRRGPAVRALPRVDVQLRRLPEGAGE
mmetsp:Transcript_17164/g.48829  ORF Transcript_17164/g.48829 Transcript_17164/m.48829 type:complete len:381 (-) Transcript_17164:882-2024(-)